jgi:RPA family protein
MNRKRSGAVERVFAGELARSTATCTWGDPPQKGVLTPSGAWLRRIFLVGVLTEVTRQGEEVTRARLADPTGTVELVFRPHNLPPADVLLTLQPPAFLACAGTTRLQGGKTVVEPDLLLPVGRAERDAWVLFTAERTLRRMEALVQQREEGDVPEEISAALTRYRPVETTLRELATMVRAALETVPREEPPRIDAEAVVREIVTTHPGVLEIAWVLEQAGERGVGEEDARRCVQKLLAEGECYSPRNGSLRLL